MFQFACQRLYFPTDLRVFDGLHIFEEQQSTRPLEKLDYHSKQWQQAATGKIQMTNCVRSLTWDSADTIMNLTRVFWWYERVTMRHYLLQLI